MLKLHWPSRVCGLVPVWTGRSAPPGEVAWHIGNGPVPDVAPGSVVLHLAAALRGGPAELARNPQDTAAVCKAAVAMRARHVFVASSAAVYAPGDDDLPETARPGPLTPYGAAKLEAERAALRMCAGGGGGPGLTILRIGNVAGADALLGGTGPVVLDPVRGQPGGPLRSYIGPGRLAQVLGSLVARAVAGQELPVILNIAEPGVLAMADLLTAAGRDWRFGPDRPGTVPRVGLDTRRLSGLVPLCPATAAGVVADLDTLKGRWP